MAKKPWELVHEDKKRRGIPDPIGDGLKQGLPWSQASKRRAPASGQVKVDRAESAKKDERAKLIRGRPARRFDAVRDRLDRVAARFSKQAAERVRITRDIERFGADYVRQRQEYAEAERKMSELVAGWNQAPLADVAELGIDARVETERHESDLRRAAAAGRVKDPSLSAAEAVEILRGGSLRADTMNALVAREDLHSDPAFRRAFLDNIESTSAPGMSAIDLRRLHILKGATPAMLREEFHVQVKSGNERNALDIVEQYQARAKEALCVQDLVPLMKSESSEIRARTIALMSLLPRVDLQRVEAAAAAATPATDFDWDGLGDVDQLRRARRKLG